ncbi:MAG TPA: zinc-binding dehydrogenase [Vicinamibacterales bacterium]|nr:zinc-binding dehydrogenase [Vicinamibacterales bacterium]
MRAVRFHAHGGPDVLVLEDAPDPEPLPGQVMVRVRACALNHLDLWQRRGLDRVTIPFPHISGADVAGDVAAAPGGEFAVGTRVFLQPGLSCGRCAACLAGRDNTCPHYDVLGYRSEGGYAEYVRVPAANVVPVPDAVSYEAAAAFPLTFLTAWHMLVTRARVAAGETVLVLAAGSGVGQAAIQVARLHGARVIATAGSAAKLARARDLGAHEVIDHYASDIAAEARRLTDKRGVDVVVEHVGQATWAKSVRALAPGGRLVTCGNTTGWEAAIDLRFLFSRQLSLLGSYMGTKAELLHAAQFLFDGRFRPLVDTVMPLAAAADAHRRLEAGDVCGKLVLTP